MTTVDEPIEPEPIERLRPRPIQSRTPVDDDGPKAATRKQVRKEQRRVLLTSPGFIVGVAHRRLLGGGGGGPEPADLDRARRTSPTPAHVSAPVPTPGSAPTRSDATCTPE